MLRSILYVSNSALGYSIDHQGRIGELVDKWRRWNNSVGITGAIVFTERHFVQLIEGPEAAIGELFAHIRADKRHTGVKVIQDTPRMSASLRAGAWPMPGRMPSSTTIWRRCCKGTPALPPISRPNCWCGCARWRRSDPAARPGARYP